MVATEFTIQALLAGLAGGALGAALGALPALSLAGVLVVVGEAAEIAARTIGRETLANPDAAGLIGITEFVGLGPALGPHVAFAGGVAAAAYAGRRGGHDGSFPYHPAKNVRTSLGSAPDVLLAGAVFGLVGVLVARLAAGLSAPLDPVALAVVVSAVGHRLAFGYPLVGRFEGPVLDMGPFERNESRGGIGGSETKSDGGTTRYAVEPWQPHHYEWANVACLGVAVGLASGYLAVVTGSAYLAFGIALASLLFLAVGMDRIPVTHHMAFPAGVIALALGGQEPWLAVIVAGVFGLLGALLGELAQRGLYAHADTHLDPSFVSLLVTSLVLGLLATVGVLDASAIPFLAA